MHERDRQTDGQAEGQTDTGPHQRTRLRIASSGKKGHPHGNNSAEYVYCAYNSINNLIVMRSATAGSRDLFRLSVPLRFWNG